MKTIVLVVLLIGAVHALKFVRTSSGSLCVDDEEGKLRFEPQAPLKMNLGKVVVSNWDVSDMLHADFDLNAFVQTRLSNNLVHHANNVLEWSSNGMIVRGCEGDSWFSLGKNKFILPPGASSILARRSGYVHMLFTGGETRILLDEDHVLVVKNVFIAADVIYEWTPERDATSVMTVNAEGCIYFEASDGIDAVTLTTAEGSIEYRNKLAINMMNVHIGNVSLTIDEGDESEENRAIIYSSVYKCSNVIETESLIPTACVNAERSTVKTQTECGCVTCDTHSCVCEKCRSDDSRGNPPPSSTSSPTSDETGPRDQHFKPKSGVAALSLFVIIIAIVVVLMIGSPRRCQRNETSEEGIEMRAVQPMQESPAQHCESKQEVVPTQPIQEPAPPVVVTPSVTTTNIQISDDDDDGEQLKK
ncbi:Hypothetical predicted protein [Cloeon dipterum]|uniref:Uncharacterized protein n=3 Tax=Cloeon dipterum TaxID=197152 RepID=A0A8S1E632_9INSE|nr:Hypothetical predicted protein [Cloeon dipterum]